MAFQFSNIGQTNFGSGSFNSRFKNPYQFSAGRVSSDTSKAILEAIKKRNQQGEFALKQERSLLDRTFDGLMTANYASANYASDWAKYSNQDDVAEEERVSFGQALNPFDDVMSGLRAGNPFGEGSEKDEKTYSKVFGEAGWNPTSGLGKFAKGTAGFVGDVLLDPTTYLSGGLSAVVKGTGRVGKTAKTLDALKSSLPKSMVDGKEITHMTEEMASHIIEKTGKVIEPEQLMNDSKALSERYNRLLGIRDTENIAKPITMGVSNLPFGDKIAGKMGVFGKTLTLSDGTAIRSMSDTLGIANSYAGLRNKIYGGKIGKLLSTTAPLKILADKDPAMLYDFMKFIDTTKGQKLNKLQSDKAIREKAKDLLNLTPAQNKEILTLLEDKTIWSKVKGTLKFSETNKAKDLSTAIAKGAEGQDALLTEADELKSIFNQVKEIESLSKAERDALEEMRSQILPDDVKSMERIDANKARIKSLQEKKEQLLKEQEAVFKVSEREKVGTPTEPVKTSPTPSQTPSKATTPKGKVDAETAKGYKQPEPVDIYADTVKEGERLHKIVEDSKVEADKFKWEREVGQILNSHKVSDRGIRERGTKRLAKETLRKDLGKYIYKGKGSLPSSFREDAMNKIVDMMRHADSADELLAILKSKDSFFGKMMPKELSDAMDKIGNDGLPEMIREYIESVPHLFSDHASEVNSYLAKKHKYGQISDLREPILRLTKKSKTKEGLTKAESAELKSKVSRLALRDIDYDKYMRKMTHKDFVEMRQAEIKAEHDAFIEKLSGDTTDRRGRFMLEDTARDSTLQNKTVVLREKEDKNGLSKFIGVKNKKEMSERARGHSGEFDEKLPLDKATQFSDFETKYLNDAVELDFTNKKRLSASKSTFSGDMTEAQIIKQMNDDAKLLMEQKSVVQSTLKEYFPRSLFTDLNTSQRNMVMGISRAVARANIANPKDVGVVNKAVKAKIVQKIINDKDVERLSTIADDAQFGKVVAFKEGEEWVEGTILRIEPNKVEKTRLEHDPTGQVKRVKEPYKNAKGKTVYREVSVQPTRQSEPYYDWDGSNSYIVRLSDGTEKTLALKQIEHVSHSPAKTFDELLERTSVIKEKNVASNDLLDEIRGKETAKQAELDALKAEDARMERVNAERKSKSEHLKKTNQERVAFEKARKERLAQIQKLDAEIKKESKSLKGRETRHTKKQNKLFDEFTTRVGMQAERVMDLEGTTAQMSKALDDVASALSGKLGKNIDMNDIDGTIEHIAVTKKNMEEALQSDEALEVYIRNNMKDGHFVVRDALYEANVLNATKTSLSERASSEEVERVVLWLRGDFNKVGKEEVKIGKLSKEQFYAMMDRYVPHIPTDDGARYFESMKELTEHRAGLTQDLGYGTKWNPFRSERTIKGANIAEINAHFAEKLKGKNLFSDNMSEIYVNRMLKHNDLMYDNEYMKTMMNDFGHIVPDDFKVLAGYKPVVNYGQVKELITSLAKNKYKNMVQSNVINGRGEMDDAMKASMFEKALDSTFADFKLSRDALDAKATPMLELSSEQLEAIHPYGITKQVNDAIVGKANNARKLAIARDENSMLKMYDKFTHFIKLQQTTIMPSFHIRNEASNDFTNYLAVGRDAFDIKLNAHALKASLAGGDLEKLKALPPIVSKDGRVYHWDEVIDLAKAHGALDEGFFAVDLGADTMSRGIGRKFIKPKFNPTDTGNFFGYRMGSKVGGVIESKARLVQFTSLLRSGSTPAQASDSVNKFLFDYSDLTQFETQVMKRIFPYYTWMRKNARLQVSELIDQTEKYAMIPKIEQGIEGMNNEEDLVSETYTSDFARDWIQTPFNTKTSTTLKDGTVKEKKEPWLLSPNLPYMDLGRLPDVFNPLDSLREFFSSTNPAMKLPIELATNKNTYFNSDLIKKDKDGKEISPIKDRLLYVAKQLAPVGATTNLVNADGAEGKGLALLNTFGGVKVTAYDAVMSKNMMMVEAIESGKGFKGEKTMYNKLLEGAGRTFGVGSRTVTSYYNPNELYPAKYKLDESDVIGFEKRKAMANKEIEAKYGAFKGDSKLQWSLMEGREDFEVAHVKKVFDGDTFLATNEKGEEFKVRVLLLDTPETVDKRKDYKMPVGKEASKHAKDTLGGKQVLLFKDNYGDDSDKYGRSLFYVHTTDGDYAKEVIKKGFGRTFFEENQTRKEEYRDVQSQASEDKEGIWGFDGYPNIGDSYFNSDVRSVREWQKKNK